MAGVLRTICKWYVGGGCITTAFFIPFADTWREKKTIDTVTRDEKITRETNLLSQRLGHGIWVGFGWPYFIGRLLYGIANGSTVCQYEQILTCQDKKSYERGFKCGDTRLPDDWIGRLRFVIGG